MEKFLEDRQQDAQKADDAGARITVTRRMVRI
jgi:hypothetical protein